MKYKIMLFLCILLVTATTISAVENITKDNVEVDPKLSDDTGIVHKEANIIKEDKRNNSVKTIPANSISVDDSYGETYYGGRIPYHTTSTTGDYPDEGKVTLYVNNTVISTEDIGWSDSFDWMYNVQNNEILDKYVPGTYPVKIVYTNEGTSIESNRATLTINKGQSQIFVNGEISVDDGKITVPVTAISSSSNELLDHGSITAEYNSQIIASTTCNSEEVLYLSIPAEYQQKTVQLRYSDNGYMLEDSTGDVFLDVIVPGSGGIDTSIRVNDARIINKTRIEDGSTVYDALAILVDVNVNTVDEKVTSGQLIAYHNNKQVATSSNASSILLPVDYNLEEITLRYTGVGGYANSTTTFTVMADKISTRMYMSYVTTTKNGVPNIYPRITSNIPYLTGKLNIYVDNNLVKTIDVREDNVYISTNGTITTIGSTLDLNGFDDGTYNLTVETEDNNVFTASEYTTTLTINKVSTYMYANNRTIYKADTTNLYAYVYANNRDVINTGLMSFTIDDELVGTEYVYNNTASIEYSIPTTLSEGKHTLIITYEGDDSYNTSNKTVTLTLAKTSTTTTLRTWTVEDEKIVLNITVRAWNKTIDTGNIKAIIDDNEVATGSVSNNSAIITLPDSVSTNKYYNLKLVYQGTDLLNSSTYENTMFIFNKKNTTVRVYPYLRSNGTVTLTSYIYSDNYAKVNNGEIIFTINNKQVATAKVNNNKANTTYDMGGYDPGNYTIRATYNGSKLFHTNTNTSIVTKNPYYHTTYMNILNKSLTVKRGSSTPINATLTCYSRNITEDINATITLNATWGTVVYTQDVTFQDGVLNTKLNIPGDFELFTFEGVEISKYTLTVNTKQSKNFKQTSGTGTVNIGQYTKLYQKTLWAYKANNVTFNSTLQDANGNTLRTNTTAKIKIYSPNTKNNDLITSIDTKIINGKLEYTYKLPGKLTNNTYLVNITVKSNKDIAGCYKTVNMTLNNRKTYISAANIVAYIGKQVRLNGSITDSTTKNRANTNANVVISIDGKEVATVKADKGAFKYTFTNNLSMGKHSLTYTYNGDTLYNTSTRTLNITSNKNTLRISAPTLTGNIGDSIRITATITNTSGQTVTEALKANILLNGKSIASNIDVTDGKLTYNYNIPSGTTTSNKITIIIQETSKYKARNATTILKVNKNYQYVNMASTTLTAKSGSKISITGNITDKNKNHLSNTQINIKISGKNVTTITTTNGKFNYEYTVTQSKGTYDVLVTALENSNYRYNAKHLSLKVTS